ncbi:MAG: dienelactone hydrolase family protein [Chloroflexi bacterium]|nr:dienelactone hydrolase family protein [Chloroflexota bacterium]
MRDQLNDMQLYLVDEFVEEYQEGHLSRREALRRIAAITGSLALATTILAACGAAEPTTGTATSTSASPSGAASASAAASGSPAASASGSPQPTSSPDPAVSVPENDPAIEAQMVEFPGEGATLMGYLARPTGDGPFPIILVCHENRGLTDHIKDVTRRVAKAGYVGMAVDLLSRQGGTASITDQAQIQGALGQAPEGQPVQDFQAGLRYAQSQAYADKAKVGMTGFCYGGGVTWRVATKTPELRAAVPFYGPAPNVADVPGIQAAVLAIYGGLDERINAGIPEIEAAMQQNNKTFQKQIYDGANHAFHNDTGRNYNPEAAKDAWAKTLAWFEQYVKA